MSGIAGDCVDSLFQGWVRRHSSPAGSDYSSGVLTSSISCPSAGIRPTRTASMSALRAHAPLFPGRRNRFQFDWAKPVVGDHVYDNCLQPAWKALGINKALGGNVCWHDLRHSFAVIHAPQTNPTRLGGLNNRARTVLCSSASADQTQRVDLPRCPVATIGSGFQSDMLEDKRIRGHLDRR